MYVLNLTRPIVTKTRDDMAGELERLAQLIREGYISGDVATTGMQDWNYWGLAHIKSNSKNKTKVNKDSEIIIDEA